MNEFIRLMQSQAAPPGTAAPREKAPQVAAREAPEKQTKEGEVDFTDAQILGNGLVTDLSEARRLHQAGFKLCKLVALTKQPEGKDWNNSPVIAIDDSATGYGVILAANGLASVDPDRLADSRSIMRALGFDLDEVMAEGALTASTRPGSGGRSVFADPGGLRWIRFSFHGLGTVLELRATSPNLQDVIPGLTYKDKTGAIRTQRFANEHRIDDRRPMPEHFAEFWRRCSTDLEFLREQQRLAGEALELRPMLSVSCGQQLAYPSPYRREFNSLFGHEVEDVLIAHGYRNQRHGGRLAAPMAEGSPSVRLIPRHDDLWQSDHASDPLQGTFDRWTVWVVLDHGDDLKAAEAAAEMRIGGQVASAFPHYGEIASRRVNELIERADRFDVGGDDEIKNNGQLADWVKSEVESEIDGVRLVELTKHHEDARQALLELLQRVGMSKVGLEGLKADESAQESAKHPVALDWDALPEDPEEVDFIIPGWMPNFVVTLFAAHGGTGKSYMAIFIALCLAAGINPFNTGMRIKRRKVLFYSAEDDITVIHLRVRRYMSELKLTPEMMKGWLTILDATSTDNVMFKGGSEPLTKRYKWLGVQLQKTGSEVLILDNASDAFDANEIERAKVRQFMAALKSLAKAVLLLSHVDAVSSMSGPDNAKGYSGSTAWHNSARSRWFMSRDKNSGVITLELSKSNYAKAGAQATIVWSDSTKTFQVNCVLDQAPRTSDYRQTLLALAKEAIDQGKVIGLSKTANNSLRAILKKKESFSSLPDKVRGAGAVDDEVKLWIDLGLARVEQYRTRSRKEPFEKLALTEAGEAAARGEG